MHVLRTQLQFGIVALFVTAAGIWTGSAQAAESLTYVLRPQPDAGVLQVELTWRTAGRNLSALCLSGSYGSVPDSKSLLRNLRVRGAKTGSEAGSCWRMRHGSRAELRVTYEVPSVQQAFDWTHTHHPLTTADFFHGVGTTFLLVPQPGTGRAGDTYQVIVRWDLPAGWRAACSWGVGRTVGAMLPVDDLRQAVYMAGKLDVERVEAAAGLDVTAVGPADSDVDVPALGKFVAKVLAGQAAFAGETELDGLVVTIVPTGTAEVGQQRLQGAGFADSMTLWLPPGVQMTTAMEHLVAHELFHTWNGQLIRPASPMSQVMWFTEGLTDYYAARLLWEDGVWSDGALAEWVNGRLRAYAVNPAAESAAGTSARSREALAYQQGLLLGLRWHALARERGMASGLDAWFRLLLDRARRDSGFRVDARGLRAAGVSALGGWFGGEFDRYVERGARIDVPEDALGAGFESVTGEAFEYDAGFDIESTRTKKAVSGLLPGSAAAQAGLREGDSVIAWYLSGDPSVEVRVKVRRGEEDEWIVYFPRGAGIDVQQFRPVSKRHEGTEARRHGGTEGWQLAQSGVAGGAACRLLS
jgi:predicted metalloprotease with PDZ domain